MLSFGAVYSWGYATLAAGIAISAFMNARRAVFRRPGSITFFLALLVAACAAQLVYLPRETLEQMGPASARFLAAADLAYASRVAGGHALSIDPRQTQLALACVLFGAAWVWVCAALAARHSGFCRSLARSVATLGVLVAVIGLAQKATFNGKLLWFWEPMSYATNAFGPFVNRNHFAGWMLLALMLSVGYLFGRLSRRAAARAAWRDHMLWMGSPEGTALLLMAAGILVMACALVWTMSRSGIAGAAIGATILLVAAAVRSRRRTLRVALAAYMIAMVSGVIAWRGSDTLFAWYGNTRTLEWRFDLWKDTLPALEDFWITGAGLNTYDALMLAYPRTDTAWMPREAHNDYLQLAVEGGLLVCIPAAMLAAALVRRILHRLAEPQDETTWWIRIGAVAGICGIAVQELTDFSLQIPGVALLFGTCLAIALHEPAPRHAHRGSKQISQT